MCGPFTTFELAILAAVAMIVLGAILIAFMRVRAGLALMRDMGPPPPFKPPRPRQGEPPNRSEPGS